MGKNSRGEHFKRISATAIPEILKVMFFTELHREVGSGHLMECLTIAEYLTEYMPQTKVYFCVIGEVWAGPMLQSKGLSYSHIRDNQSLQRELGNKQPDICVCNVREVNMDIQEMISSTGVKSVVIDELGKKTITADLLINFSPIEEWHKYELLNNKMKLCFGLRYAILRKHFEIYHNMTKAFHSDHILVSMGGVDRSNTTLKIIESLVGLKNVKKTVILGAGFKHTNHPFQKLDGSFEIKRAVSSMSEYMFHADLIFTAGGNTIYEAACIGTPAIILWEDIHECKQGEWFAKKGVAIVLGQGSKVEREDIIEATSELLFSKIKLSMSKIGKKLIDGKGAQRIVKCLSRL